MKNKTENKLCVVHGEYAGWRNCCPICFLETMDARPLTNEEEAEIEKAKKAKIYNRIYDTYKRAHNICHRENLTEKEKLTLEKIVKLFEEIV